MAGLVREGGPPGGDVERRGEDEAADERGGDHEQTAHEHVATQFAHQLGLELSRARAEGLFGDLILVAEPKFLGLLRGALDAATARQVVNSVTKDLAGVPAHAVASHVADVLPL